MIKIEATVMPRSLPVVIEVIRDLGCTGCTVTEVRTDLLSSTDWMRYRGNLGRRFAALASAFRVEVTLPQARLEETLELLTRTLADTGHGEGRILVLPVSGAARIRTGEMGEDAGELVVPYKAIMAARGETVFGEPGPVKTCPACLSDDLPAAAAKCKYCGTEQAPATT